MTKIYSYPYQQSYIPSMIDLHNLARSYQQWGETAKAIAYYKQVLIMSQQFQDKSASGVILRDLGQVYRNLGQVVHCSFSFWYMVRQECLTYQW